MSLILRNHDFQTSNLGVRGSNPLRPAIKELWLLNQRSMFFFYARVRPRGCVGNKKPGANAPGVLGNSELLNVVFYCVDSGDAEVFYQDIGHIR